MPTMEESIERLEEMYEESITETKFDILHIYPRELTQERYVRHCRFFKVVGFNCSNKTKRDLGIRDNITPFKDDLPLALVQVYADGATLLKFAKKVRVNEEYLKTQTLWLSVERTV